MHRGVLEGLTDGRLCTLDAKAFQDIVQHFDHPEFDPWAYAAAFVEYLNEILEEDEYNVTDLSNGAELDLQTAMIGGSPRVTLRRKSRSSGILDLIQTPFRRPSVLVESGMTQRRHPRSSNILSMVTTMNAINTIREKPFRNSILSSVPSVSRSTDAARQS